MTYLLVGTWLVGAYAFGWYRGRQGWPFLWRKTATQAAPVPRATPVESKPIVLPVDEPDRMKERLTELVPGFAQMPPEQQAKVIERLKHRAENQLGLLTR